MASNENNMQMHAKLLPIHTNQNNRNSKMKIEDHYHMNHDEFHLAEHKLLDTREIAASAAAASKHQNRFPSFLRKKRLMAQNNKFELRSIARACYERRRHTSLAAAQRAVVVPINSKLYDTEMDDTTECLLVKEASHAQSYDLFAPTTTTTESEVELRQQQQHHYNFDYANSPMVANQLLEESTTKLISEDKKQLCGPLEVTRNQPFVSSLLLFIPLGYCAYFLEWSDTLIFCTNFMAIVPQAWLMGKATEDLATHMGQIAGGLLNAWFGNIVEMLLCISGLRAGQLLVVKATLVGSILSNLLLVAGCSFLLGGFYHKVQEFSAIGAATNASLMTLSCLCLGLPTMYGTIYPSSVISGLNISRSVSFFLFFMYVQYLIFQLWTHSFLFEGDDNDGDEADLSLSWAAFVLGLCTVCCTFNSEFLVHSIEGTVNSWNISKSFIGIILLPIIGNAAEHYTSVVVAMRNKMDLSLACAIGSSCQMALFVTPFTVLMGWVLGQPMSLDLHAFEMTVLLLSVLIVTSILQDGYSNWLEGSMLVSAYLVIALIYFFEDPQA